MTIMRASRNQSAAADIADGLNSLPGASIYSRRATAMVERFWLAIRSSQWLMFASGFMEPLFYLGAFGYGLGSFIGNVQADSTHTVSYAAFLAPALLANSAMNGAIYESTWNVFFKMHFAKLYQGIMATSMGPLDVALGEIMACLLRGLIYAIAFMAVMLPLGLIPCWWGGLLAIPAAMFIAFGFASCGLAITSYLKSFQQMDWVQFALLPMLLFSGSFYSLDVYPTPIRILLEALPLHQGVALIRGLTLGQLDYALLGHLAYFTVMAVGGVIFATKRIEAMFLR